MGIFIKHILRNLEENIGRTLLILFTLFGVGLIVSLCVTFIYAEKDYIKLMTRNETPFDYMITTNDLDKEINYEKLQQFSSDISYLGFAKMDNGYIFVNDEYKQISLSNFDFDNAKKFNFIDNKDFKLLDNEIIIDKTIAVKSKIKKGNTIRYFNSEGKSFDLIVKYFSNNSLSAGGSFIIANENTYKKIMDSENLKYDFFVGIYEGNEDIETFNKNLYNSEDEYGISIQYFNFNNLINANINRILKVTVVILIIALVIVYFVLNSIVKIIMNERIPVVGSFRSVGASNKKMTILLLCEMGIYGLLGGLLGSLVSTKFTGSIFRILYDMENLVSDGNATSSIGSIELSMILFTTLLLIAFQISLSIHEILSFNNISIKECIFGKNEGKYKRSFGKMLLGIFFLIIGCGTLLFTYRMNYTFGVIALFSIFISLALLLPILSKLIGKIINKGENPVLTMAFHTVNENKLQVSTNIIIAVLTSVSIVAISFLNYYVNSNNEEMNYVKSNIYVASQDESLGTASEILALDNVKNVSTIYTGKLEYDEIEIANNKLNAQNSEIINLIYSDNVNNLKEATNAISTDYNTWKNLKNDEVIISEYYKKKYNIKLNDIIKIKLTTKEKTFSYDVVYDLKVVGFADADTDRIAYNFIIVPERMFFFEILSISQDYFINLHDESKLNETQKEIKKYITYDYAEIYSQKEYKDYLTTAVNLTKGMIYALIGVIVAIGLVGIINNQTVSFLEQSKHLAILYSTCMSRKQLSKLLLKELVISYSISAFISIFFALVLSYLFIYTVDALGFYIPLKFNIFWTFLLLLIIGFIMMIIYLVMKMKVKNLNIVEELKYE